MKTIFAILLFGLVSSNTVNANEPLRFYIGTGADADVGGIFLSSINLQTGTLLPPERAAAASQNAFVALHPNLPVLYSVAELYSGDDKKVAGITAWKIDPVTGHLTKINHQPAGGTGACFVIARGDGGYAALANYGSGSISLYPLQKDGSLDAATANVQHEGTGPVESRQSEPHAHSVRFDTTGHRLLAADLGTNDIFIYDISTDGKLTPSTPPSLIAPPGSGPRHFVFSPDGRFVLSLGELDGTISTFSFDPVNANAIHTASTMVEGVPEDAVRASAEILFHPKLPVVYCSNRGPNEIATFDFDTQTGHVTRRSAIACGGTTPRNFRLTPDGRFLLVANQGSNNVAVFSVDDKGNLSPTDQSISVPTPMCIKFIGDRS